MPTERDTTPKQQRSSSTILTKGMVLVQNGAMTIDAANRPVPSLDMPLPTLKFDQLLPIAEEAWFAPPRPYRTGLIPLPSTLRPHCWAWDRLCLWWPLSSWSSSKGKVEVLDSDLERILDVINVSWATGTRDAYGAVLKYFGLLDLVDCHALRLTVKTWSFA